MVTDLNEFMDNPQRYIRNEFILSYINGKAYLNPNTARYFYSEGQRRVKAKVSKDMSTLVIIPDENGFLLRFKDDKPYTTFFKFAFLENLIEGKTKNAKHSKYKGILKNGCIFFDLDNPIA